MDIPAGNYRVKDDLSREELEFLKAEYETGTLVDDIAVTLSIRPSMVSHVAKELGCAPRRVIEGKKRGADDIDDAIEQAKKAQQRLEVTIRELEAKKKISFEYNDVKQTVLITGVSRHFLGIGGVAQFREWLTKQFSV